MSLLLTCIPLLQKKEHVTASHLYSLAPLSAKGTCHCFSPVFPCSKKRNMSLLLTCILLLHCQKGNMSLLLTCILLLHCQQREYVTASHLYSLAPKKGTCHCFSPVFSCSIVSKGNLALLLTCNLLLHCQQREPVTASHLYSPAPKKEPVTASHLYSPCLLSEKGTCHCFSPVFTCFHHVVIGDAKLTS